MSDNSLPVFVALSGRVPVKVSTENGQIKAGDYLTSSSIPGVAMKANSDGMMIGQALTSYDGVEVGQVIVFIKNTYSSAGYSIKQQAILLGDISPKNISSSTENGLTSLISTIQSEAARDSGVIIGKKISDGKEFLTDFVAARVTAIRGYFDEVFAKKVHTEQLCVKKSDGSEVCVNGDQIQSILDKTNTSSVSTQATSSSPASAPVNTPDSTSTSIEPVSTTTDPVIEPVPVVNPPASDTEATSTGEVIATPVSEPIATPTPEPVVEVIPAETPIVEVTPVPDPVPAPTPEPVVETAPAETP